MLAASTESRCALRVVAGEGGDSMSSSSLSPLLPLRKEGGRTNGGPRPAVTAGGAGVEGAGGTEGREGKESRGAALGVEATGVRGEGWALSFFGKRFIHSN